MRYFKVSRGQNKEKIAIQPNKRQKNCIKQDLFHLEFTSFAILEYSD